MPVRVTYTLAEFCVDWCPHCENKMELNQCGPFECTGIPGVICVSPHIGTVPCVVCKDNLLPDTWLFPWSPNCPRTQSTPRPAVYTLRMSEGECSGGAWWCAASSEFPGAGGCDSGYTSQAELDAELADWYAVGQYEGPPTCFPGTIYSAITNSVSADRDCALAITVRFTNPTVWIEWGGIVRYSANFDDLDTVGCNRPLTLVKNGSSQPGDPCDPLGVSGGPYPWPDTVTIYPVTLP